MNHQPFETWLLEGGALTPQEKRDLDAHLKVCAHCAALAETGLALKSARMVSPAPGFTARFQQRLVARRAAERRMKFWGAIVFIIGGLALLGILFGPVIGQFLDSPTDWITMLVGYFLFILTSTRAMSEVGFVLLRVIPNFVPPYVWMVIISALAGIGLLWSVSIWRFARRPQGV
jgi:hypothetical protein